MSVFDHVRAFFRRHPGFFMGLGIALGVGGGYRLLESGYTLRGAVALALGVVVFLAYVAESALQQHRRQARREREDR